MLVLAKGNCEELIERQARKAGKKWSIYVTESKSYRVYGLSFYNESSAFGTGLYYEILDDFGNLTSAPSDAFEVVEERVNSDWVVRSVGDNFFVWPELFYEKYFFDDFSEGIPGVIEKFENMRNAQE